MSIYLCVCGLAQVPQIIRREPRVRNALPYAVWYRRSSTSSVPRNHYQYQWGALDIRRHRQKKKQIVYRVPRAPMMRSSLHG
jgi:hypothetical protein